MISRRNMMDRYKKKFKEMAFDKEIYTRRLQGDLLNIFNHFLKLKLADPAFGDHIYKGISSYVKPYVDDWKMEIEIFTKGLFEKLNDDIPKGCTKESAYRNALENIPTTVESELYRTIMKKTLSDFKDKNEVEKPFRFFRRYTTTYKEEWFVEIYEFMYSLKPKRNKVIDIENAIVRVANFTEEFIRK